jgi:hypothetical protein
LLNPFLLITGTDPLTRPDLNKSDLTRNPGNFPKIPSPAPVVGARRLDSSLPRNDELRTSRHGLLPSSCYLRAHRSEHAARFHSRAPTTHSNHRWLPVAATLLTTTLHHCDARCSLSATKPLGDKNRVAVPCLPRSHLVT